MKLFSPFYMIKYQKDILFQIRKIADPIKKANYLNWKSDIKNNYKLEEKRLYVKMPS